MNPDRIAARFAALKEQKRAGLVTFVTAGDPDYATSLDLVRALPAAGADIIELGMPFSDPMADGVAIQAASVRALKAGQTLARTLDMAAEFRQTDTTTPLILMGYYNPIYSFGVQAFIEKALASGIDGLIIVDLPPEEDDELCAPARAQGLHFIRLAAPTSSDERLPDLLKNSSGFVYYINVLGITGGKTAQAGNVTDAVARLRRYTDLPIAAGFGVKTPDQAREIAGSVDAVVVGSAIVERIAQSASTKSPEELIANVTGFVRELAEGVADGVASSTSAK